MKNDWLQSTSFVNVLTELVDFFIVGEKSKIFAIGKVGFLYRDVIYIKIFIKRYIKQLTKQKFGI